MRTYKLALFLLIPFLLSGCVWLRLLRTKSQLGEFNTYFKIEKTKDAKGYTLLFNKPLLSTDDILYITFAPNSRTKLPHSPHTEVWAYLFEKENSPTVAPMHVYLYFTHNKLTKVTFPQTFASLLTPQQLRAICTAIGKASILKSERIVNATVPSHNKPLTLQHLQKIMGRANLRGHEPTGDYYLYHYHLRNHNKRVWVKLYFNKQHTCIKMQTHLAGGFINIFFKL